MKRFYTLMLFYFISLQIQSQILPEIELDYISTLSGKKYSGAIMDKNSDSLFLKVNSRVFSIAISQIDTIRKKRLEYPFIKDSPYSEITLSISPYGIIKGNLIEFKFQEFIRFQEVKTGKVYNLLWNQFRNLKTMDPKYYYFDIIEPALSGPVKGEFIEVIDKDRFLFVSEDGKKAEYYFSRVDKIHVRHPERFQIPERFKPSEKKQEKGNILSSIGGGFLVPFSNDSQTRGESTGLDDIGYSIYSDLNFPISELFLFGGSFIYQSIPTKFRETNDYTIEADDWTNIWILAGPMLVFRKESMVTFFTFQMGVLIPTYPNQSYNNTSNSRFSYTVSGSADSKFAKAFGAGIGQNHFIFSVKYLTAEPEFNISIVSRDGTANGKYTADISTLIFCVGYKF